MSSSQPTLLDAVGLVGFPKTLPGDGRLDLAVQREPVGQREAHLLGLVALQLGHILKQSVLGLPGLQILATTTKSGPSPARTGLAA